MEDSPLCSSIDLITDLSVLVITFHGKCSKRSFVPDPTSSKKIEWFEGTGTVIGSKRNVVFIMTALHCQAESKFSYFIKGVISSQEQVPATLVLNKFVEENNGIDIAILSCSADLLDAAIVSRAMELQWQRQQISHCIGAPVWLIHFPTVTDVDQDSTHRLKHPVNPTVSQGYVLSQCSSDGTFDSTITATGGSSGGLVIDSAGTILGAHDSQHDDTADNSVASTHREVREIFSHLECSRQLSHLEFLR